MNKIKTFTASLLFAFATSYPAFAATEPSETNNTVQAAEPGVVETGFYTSKICGITVEVPKNAKVFSDDAEHGIDIHTPDENYIINIIPFNMKDEKGDDVSNAYAKMLVASHIAPDKSIRISGKTETLGFEGSFMSYTSGGCAVCSIFFADDERAFLITIVAAAEYVQSVPTTYRTISFNRGLVK